MARSGKGKITTYLEFAETLLKKGATKAECVRALCEKYPDLKRDYFRAIVYQRFNGMYNDNTGLPKPKSKAGSKSKGSASKTSPKAASDAPPKTPSSKATSKKKPGSVKKTPVVF